jgi:glycosyltransferase involved in cell wall biosynthesis
MRVSYAITVCNEHKELERLLDQIHPNLKEGDEIVVLVDENRKTEEVMIAATKYFKAGGPVDVLVAPFLGNFADHKNRLIKECKGDYIFFIDADEYLSDALVQYVHEVLEENPVDLFMVPRKNTVSGLTDEHVQTWGWRVDEQGRVNWPDYQMRIVANKPGIKWQGKVHERMTGYASTCSFPAYVEDWCLIHPKTIERQEKQNKLYSKL